MNAPIRLKVFLAGSNGVLGRNVARQLRRRGHEVVGLIRNKEKGAALESIGVKTVVVPNIFNSDAIAEVSKGSEIFINTISPLPLDAFKDVEEEEKEIAKKLRIESAKSLCLACHKVQCKVFLHQSLYWSVRPEGGGTFTEDSTSIEPKFEDFLEGEKKLLQFAQTAQISAIILRFGLLYGEESSITQKIARRIFQNKLPIVGEGDNELSLLHVEDAASSFVVAAEKIHRGPHPSSTSGIYHIADDEPTSMASMLKGMAEKMGAVEPFSVPVWMARMGASSEAVDFLTSSAITSNEKFKKTFGWNPKFKNFEEGIVHVTESWKKDGTLKRLSKG